MCNGRCQKSDSELNYLEEELEKRQNQGMKINLRGIFALESEPEKPNNSLKKQEKMENLMKNPELKDLPPRYLDILL